MMNPSLHAKFRTLFSGKNTKKALIIIALTGCAAALPAFFAAAQIPLENNAGANVAPSAAAVSQDTQRTAAIILVKNALLAVNQGNLTGNYTVLRDLASPGFRERN